VPVVPYGGNLVIFAPFDPAVDMVAGEGADATVAGIEDFADVGLLRRANRVFFLKSSREVPAGSCCWRESPSPESAERTVSMAMASMQKVMCLYHAL